MQARERFLNPNNATLVVIGDVPAEPGDAERSANSWASGEKANCSFLQPSNSPQLPIPRTLIINAPADQSVEIRLAVRGFARSDPDATAATLLAIVARQRWEKFLPELARSPVFVRRDAFALPGMFVMGATVENLLAGKALATAREVMKSLASTPVTPAELEQAKNEVTSGCIIRNS